MKLLNSIYVKIISWLLVVSFIVVFVFNDYAYASKAIQIQTDNLSPDIIDIPVEYGNVIDRYSPGGSRRQVILVQDLHANYEVQKNIKMILDFIDKNYGIARIGVEGNSSDVDASILNAAQEEHIKREVIEYFMKKNLITGPEEFAAYRKPHILEGLEDRDLYEQDTSLLFHH